MLLSKEQKNKLKSDGVVYYSGTTYFFVKILLIIITFYFLVSSFKLASKKLYTFKLTG